MRRLILLTIGLSLLLWAAAVRTATAPPAVEAMYTVAASLTDGARQPSGANPEWHPQQRTVAAITESSWKLMPVHTAPGARLAPLPAISGAHGSPARTGSSLPLSLRHTPLLI